MGHAETVQGFRSLKAHAVCRRVLDNEPEPLDKCDITRCDECTLGVAKVVWLEDVEQLENHLRQIVEPCKEGYSKPYIPLGKEEGVIWLAKQLVEG